MPTAPSYSNYQILEAPYKKNGKQYVKVKHPVTKIVKEVRWYIDKNAKVDKKKILGFADGPITIIRDIRDEETEYFLNNISPARFNVHFGWYIPSTIHYDLPPSLNLKTADIAWNEVSANDTDLDINLISKTLAVHFTAEERKHKNVFSFAIPQ